MSIVGYAEGPKCPFDSFVKGGNDRWEVWLTFGEKALSVTNWAKTSEEAERYRILVHSILRRLWFEGHITVLP